MKGVIFNILEDFITENWGAETYEEILSACPLHTKEPFVGPGTYPDADLMTIVGKTTERLGISVPVAVHAFGRYAFPKLAAKYPVFVRDHTHPKSFLKTIEDVIHVEVRKLDRDAHPPRMAFIDPAPDRLILRYASPRKLCPLVAGFLEGVGDFFKSEVRYEHTTCMQQGAESCEFHVHFRESAKSGAEGDSEKSAA